MPGLREVVVMALVVSGSAAAAAAQEAKDAVCKAETALASLPELPEASGLARGSGSRLWMHNDSGAAELFAVDPKGSVVGRVTLNGAKVEDWEALASGPCGKRTCIYVGDIGDNDASRKQITIYRLPEPAKPGGSAQAEAFHGTFPDGAHDAETLLVAPDGTVLVVTKGETGPVAVYKFPRDLKAGTAMQLERIGKSLSSKTDAKGRVTDGAFSANGKWVVLRTRQSLAFYDGAEFLRGEFKAVHRVDLASLNEPQGEAVTFGAGDTLYVGGEGGGKKQPGTLAALSCNP